MAIPEEIMRPRQLVTGTRRVMRAHLVAYYVVCAECGGERSRTFVSRGQAAAHALATSDRECKACGNR